MSKKATIHIGTLYAKPDQADNLIASFEGLKQAKGYISHECYQDIDNSNKLTLVEEWETKADHENFVSSFSADEMEQWLSLLACEGEDSYYEKIE